MGENLASLETEPVCARTRGPIGSPKLRSASAASSVKATPPKSMTFVHAAEALAGHLASHQLPEPVSLSVTSSYGDSTVTAQLRATTTPVLVADLLAWSATVNAATAQAWRSLERDQVHLSIRGTLTSPAGVVELKVFGGVDYDPLRFADLQPHPYRAVPLSLETLHGWAASSPDVAGRDEPQPPGTGVSPDDAH